MQSRRRGHRAGDLPCAGSPAQGATASGSGSRPARCGRCLRLKTGRGGGRSAHESVDPYRNRRHRDHHGGMRISWRPVRYTPWGLRTLGVGRRKGSLPMTRRVHCALREVARGELRRGRRHVQELCAPEIPASGTIQALVRCECHSCGLRRGRRTYARLASWRTPDSTRRGNFLISTKPDQNNSG